MRAHLVVLSLLSACPEPAPLEGSERAPGAMGPGSPGAGTPGEPPPGGASPGTPPGGPGDGGPAGGPGAGPGDAGGAMGAAGKIPNGAPSSEGTFAEGLPDTELVAAFSQEDLADGPEIKGELACTGCVGQLLVRVLPPPPDANAGAEARKAELKLITTAIFPAVGPFSLRVPGDVPLVVLQVVDDANSDGQPSAGERMGMPKGGPLVVAEPPADLRLEVGVFPMLGPSSLNPAPEVPEGNEVPAGGVPAATPVPHPSTP